MSLLSSSLFLSPPKVVAIVMDIFTDVDLLSEVLDAAARRVPVYILLDEINSQLFLDAAAKCKVNLNCVDVSIRWDARKDWCWDTVVWCYIKS